MSVDPAENYISQLKDEVEKLKEKCKQLENRCNDYGQELTNLRVMIKDLENELFISRLRNVLFSQK